ncbi:winged helix-turn-helix domain-containing protein [Kitasatospora azatica]|uniref:winged helix-turn-helix domain-containing protein n=1 Tax=Kitasatospora azatica TaxID=58347 RepID=UPI0007C78068|nr:winged helix-turn-helix domain-containing protein [Kitasatospora azatica]
MTATERGNLPAAFTGFVGRQHEIAEIRRLLCTRRFVTLTGMGGVGKTRLALEVAAAARDAFPDGVWLVDLAPVSGPSAVTATASSALRVPDLGALPVLDRLAGYLAERRALLMLDNCEHLLDACAELAGTLLAAAPELRILATSRHTLDVRGEQVFALPPLPEDEAVELLRDRATAVRPDFRVDEADRPALARLCADLDGLPLAIELAASRLRTLSVGQLTERLENRFTLLTGGSRSGPVHHRTMRGVIDWSHELCTPAERLLWDRLTVFAGGFSLDAAENVCSGGAITGAEVLDLLDRLVAQSVVLTYEVDGLPRYRLLATIREYGRERLRESGEQDELRRRHRDFFLALAERVNRTWYGPGQSEKLAGLRVEHANLLAALDYDGDPRPRFALAADLCWHWCTGGFLSEGRRWFDQAFAASSEPSPERARALLSATWVAQTQGDLATADRWLDEADALGESLGDAWVRNQVSGLRGVSAHYRGRPEESICRYENAWKTATALGDEREAASWLVALAGGLAYTGDPRAAETGGRVVTAAEASGERWGRAQVLMALGHDAWARGDRERTEALVGAALESMRGFNDHAMLARMLELLAWAAADGGNPWRAARLLGAAAVLWRDAGSSISAFGPQLAEQHARCERAAIDALGEAPYAKAFAEGGALSTPCQAVGFALAAESDGGTEPGESAPPVPEEPGHQARADTDQQPGAGTVRFGDLVYCSASLEVYRSGERVHLTTTELKLWREFVASPGTVLTREILLDRVWDYAWSGDSHVVDVQVMRLRAKIGRDRIETVRGFGYKLRA